MAIYALLIGINYTTSTQYRLYGCINDCILFRELLVSSYGVPSTNIVFLRDDIFRSNAQPLYPSGGNILREMRNVVSRVKEGDTLYIHFSGHGSSIRDTTGDERDSMDEFIVPVDYFTLGTMIRDDDINRILQSLPRNVLTYMVFDSCHSGTVADLRYSYYATNNVVGSNSTYTEIVENKGDRLSNKAMIVCISGCRDNQQSLDIATNGTPNGALSLALWNAIKSIGMYAPMSELMNSIYEYLRQNNYTTQQPVLSCNQSILLNKILFMKGNAPPPTPSFTEPITSLTNIVPSYPVSTYAPPPQYYKTPEAELHIVSGVKPTTTVQNLLVELVEKKLLTRNELENVFHNLFPLKQIENAIPTRSETSPVLMDAGSSAPPSLSETHFIAKYNMMRLFQ